MPSQQLESHYCKRLENTYCQLANTSSLPNKIFWVFVNRFQNVHADEIDYDYH